MAAIDRLKQIMLLKKLGVYIQIYKIYLESLLVVQNR